MPQTCPHCGTELPRTAEFCTECLVVLTTSDEPVPADKSLTPSQKAEVLGESVRFLVAGPTLLALIAFCMYRLWVATSGGDLTEAFWSGFGTLAFGLILYVRVKAFWGAMHRR